MSDTPRTNALCHEDNVLRVEDAVALARELEMELNAVTRQLLSITRLWKAASIKLGEQRALEIESGTLPDNAEAK